MQGSLVIMVMGEDRPGIVERIAQLVQARGGNWDESRMVRLAGRFAGVLSVTVPVERIGELREALEGLSHAGLTVFVELSSESDVRPLERYRPLTLSLTGTVREGIVREVTSVLARHEVNVDEIQTRTVDAAWSGHKLFEVDAKLRCPPELSIETLQAAVESLSSELAVDIELAEPA